MSDININIHDYIQNISTKSLSKGEVIFKQGARSDGTMYFVLEGAVDVFWEEDGVQQRINHIDNGGFFGEVALLSAEPRTATVVASERVKLGLLDQQGFVRIARTSPSFLYQLLRVILARLKKTETRLSQVQHELQELKKNRP